MGTGSRQRPVPGRVSAAGAATGTVVLEQGRRAEGQVRRRRRTLVPESAARGAASSAGRLRVIRRRRLPLSWEEALGSDITGHAVRNRGFQHEGKALQDAEVVLHLAGNTASMLGSRRKQEKE